MYGKNNMETYITICKIDSQLEFAVWLRKLKQGLCYQPRQPLRKYLQDPLFLEAGNRAS